MENLPAQGSRSARQTTRSTRGVHEQPSVRETGNFEGKITENLTTSERTKFEKLQKQAKYGNLQENNPLRTILGSRTLQDKTQRNEVLDEMKQEVAQKKRIFEKAENFVKGQESLEKQYNEKGNQLKQLRGKNPPIEFAETEYLQEVKTSMEQEKLAFEKAQKNLEEMNTAIVESDTAIIGLQEAGLSLAATVALGEAVAQYRVAVDSYIEKTNAGQFADETAVNNAMASVKKALLEVSEGLNMQDIEEKIQFYKNEVDQLTEKQSLEPKEAKNLRKAKKLLKSFENLQLALFNDKYGIAPQAGDQSARHERIGKTHERWLASIAQDGSASKLFDQIRENEKTDADRTALDENLAKEKREVVKNLGILASLDQNMEDLRHIGAKFALNKGTEDFQRKNLEIIEVWKNRRDDWVFTLLSLGIGNLVAMAVQYYYSSASADTEAIRISTNNMIDDLLGIPKNLPVGVEIIPIEEPHLQVGEDPKPGLNSDGIPDDHDDQEV